MDMTDPADTETGDQGPDILMILQRSEPPAADVGIVSARSTQRRDQAVSKS